jgi:signal transduction histidine kinase
VTDEHARDIEAVQRIPAVASILDVVCRVTGMGFAAVARVTEERWVACAVLDNVRFGLPAGGELKIETTLCNEIRQHRQVIVFDDADADPVYARHHTPSTYGLRSYISVPIELPDGRFFGTLCAIDPAPHKVNTPETVGMFKLFAELIAHHLDADEKLRATREDLSAERRLGEFREQFIAVLGHDLRNPLAALSAGTNRLLRDGWTEQSTMILTLMKASIQRSQALVDNVMDFARARLGGGITLVRDPARDLDATLLHVVEELRSTYPERRIDSQINIGKVEEVDHERIGQLFSNLVGNALAHGDPLQPVRIRGLIVDHAIELVVANGGEPIPRETVGALFQPFLRGGKHQGQGLGLGLYIASKIAEAHGGTIEVHSDVSETRFTFRMPLQ